MLCPLVCTYAHHRVLALRRPEVGGMERGEAFELQRCSVAARTASLRGERRSFHVSKKLRTKERAAAAMTVRTVCTQLPTYSSIHPKIIMAAKCSTGPNNLLFIS